VIKLIERLQRSRRTDAFAGAASPMHFYCYLDENSTSPICGGSRPAVEDGPDCPMCGLVADGSDPCPYCREFHDEGEF
jgi:hypothetical protein